MKWVRKRKRSILFVMGLMSLMAMSAGTLRRMRCEAFGFGPDSSTEAGSRSERPRNR